MDNLFVYKLVLIEYRIEFYGLRVLNLFLYFLDFYFIELWWL